MSNTPIQKPEAGDPGVGFTLHLSEEMNGLDFTKDLRVEVDIYIPTKEKDGPDWVYPKHGEISHKCDMTIKSPIPKDQDMVIVLPFGDRHYNSDECGVDKNGKKKHLGVKIVLSQDGKIIEYDDSDTLPTIDSCHGAHEVYAAPGIFTYSLTPKSDPDKVIYLENDVEALTAENEKTMKVNNVLVSNEALGLALNIVDVPVGSNKGELDISKKLTVSIEALDSSDVAHHSYIFHMIDQITNYEDMIMVLPYGSDSDIAKIKVGAQQEGHGHLEGSPTTVNVTCVDGTFNFAVDNSRTGPKV